jgi:hypothetical protein
MNHISHEALALAQQLAKALGPDFKETVQLVIHGGGLRRISIIRSESFTIEPKEAK